MTGSALSCGTDTLQPDAGKSGEKLSRPGVGHPKQEQLVTESVARSVRDLLPPGQGYRSYVLQEVELGVGRPDLLVLLASPAALHAAMRQRPRLANLTEAQVLAALVKGTASRVTGSHRRAVERRLGAAGWSPSLAGRLGAKQFVRDALLIEAKVRDWHSGLVQLERERWAASRTALAVPSATGLLVKLPALRRTGIGLIVTNDGAAAWAEPTTASELTLLAQLWLSELLMREVLEQRR